MTVAVNSNSQIHAVAAERPVPMRRWALGRKAIPANDAAPQATADGETDMIDIDDAKKLL